MLRVDGVGDPHGGRARFGGVGPRHTIDEPDEPRGAIFGGAWGEKGAGQGEHRLIEHSPDTERGTSVPVIERCATSSTARQSSKVGAVCGNAAREHLDYFRMPRFDDCPC
jgi:hypothetical protein